jgi:hypothetical protein
MYEINIEARYGNIDAQKSFYHSAKQSLLNLSLRGAVPQATKQSSVYIQTTVCRLDGIASG